PETPMRSTMVEGGGAQRAMGLVLTELAPEERRALDVPCGLKVQHADGVPRPGTLQAGDVIVAVNETRFATRAKFDRLVGARADPPLALLVHRSGRSRYVALESKPLERARRGGMSRILRVAGAVAAALVLLAAAAAATLMYSGWYSVAATEQHLRP